MNSLDNSSDEIQILEKNDNSIFNVNQDHQKSVADVKLYDKNDSKDSNNGAEIISLDDSEEIFICSDAGEPLEKVDRNISISTQPDDDVDSSDIEGNMVINESGEEDFEVEENNKSGKSIKENENKNLTSLIDNQVQCVNLHCQSGYDLAEAPVFVLTYFGVLRRKNVLQKVCRECFDVAVKHQEKLCNMLMNKKPLLEADFPSQKDDVVVMDSVEEIYEEEILSESVISLVEEQLIDLMKDAWNKYDVDSQIEKNQIILNKKYENLANCNKKINNELASIEKQLKETRALIYKDFIPKIKSLPTLNILESTTTYDKCVSPKGRGVATKRVTQFRSPSSSAAPPASTLSPNTNAESHDIVAVKEVEVPQVKLPPIGILIYPILIVESPVYAMRVSFFGVWLRAKVVDIFNRTQDSMSSGHEKPPTTYRVRFETPYLGSYYKLVSGKQIAYSRPSSVRYPVGTRVIALFHNTDGAGKDAYYAGVIAEPPKILNIFRYLVFFDDGYAQYVPHEKILLVCESSRHVYEDVHIDSRDFIKNYLDQYPERPMVKLQKGQVVKTEWNGKWWLSRVMAIDGSLVKMHFEADNRTEWIYRGSTRLGPLYSELIAAAARKEQGALSRHRSLGIASLKKRNMPYVEYSVDQDDTKSSQTSTTVSKNVAKKSTSKASLQDNDKNVGPPKPDEKMEYKTKGYVRMIDLVGRLHGRAFAPHQCGPSCTDWTKYSQKDSKGINPLAIPFFYGFQRQMVKIKGKKGIAYRGPCGRRLRNLNEMHLYLRITKSTMGIDLFDFDNYVRVLDEFHLEPNMYCTHIKDISYGQENIPVSCVNEINHSWPSFMSYSTSRIPQEGVNICLDEEFLVCCDCNDDCVDKDKCECWQLTIEGTKLGPGGKADLSAGYQFKRLQEPVTTGIYECNQRCKCASTCLNRVAQHPLQLNLQVFKTLKKGWGLRTLNDIPKGGFICIYAGRLHTEQSANDDGRMYGDEYLAELDYIEVVERFKEGYESDVIEPDQDKNNEDNSREDVDDEGEEIDETDDGQMNGDDIDYVPQGICKFPQLLPESVVNTRGRNKKINSEEKTQDRGEIEKGEAEDAKECVNPDDEDDGEMKKKPSKFTAAVPVADGRPPKYKSVREMFGDGADDCYIMDAKSSGNIGRYLNHSCQPNVFVQNVFVDTHDIRFPWVAFFALSHIRAGTELTWDYNYDVGSVPGKVLYCYCNSTECRGRLL